MLEYNFNVEYLQGIPATRVVISQSETTTAARKDTKIQMVMQYMTSKWPPRKTLSGTLLMLYDVADEL